MGVGGANRKTAPLNTLGGPKPKLKPVSKAKEGHVRWMF